MAETGSQILSYRGDQNLGAGVNADIPVINPNSNLNTINNTARDIALINHDNNIKLYDQKVKDRDKTLELLAAGQVASGDIDPSDRPVYEKAKQETKDAFYDMIKGGGLNNPEAVRNYQDKVTELYNTAVHAQGRQIEYKKLAQEKSQQSLPEDISLYDNHINAERKKDFWQPINPLQKAFNYDIDASTGDVLGVPVTESQIGASDSIGAQTATTRYNTVTDKNGVVTQKQTTKTAPLKSAQITKPGKGVSTTGINVNKDGTLSEISYTPEKYWDFPTIEKNVQEQYISDPKARYTYQSWLNDVEKLPPDQKIKLLQAYNNRIADYSTQRGVQPDGTNQDGSPHYPAQVQYFSDPVSGQTHINETPASFFAKHALASIKGDYVEKPQAVFNKDIGNYNIQKERASSDSFYKHAMAGAANTKARAYAANLHQQMKIRKTAAEQDNFLDEIYTRNIVQNPLIEGKGDNKVSLSFIPANRSLPVFTLDGKTPKQLIPIGATPVYDRYVYNSDGKKTDEPEKGAKITHYEGGHYEPEYVSNGRTLTPDNIRDNYLNFKKIAGKNWDGSIEDYLKLQVSKINKDGTTNYDVKIRGANGVTDRGLSLAAQRIISNQGTKKGQTAVFDNEQPPLDEQITEESSRTTDSDTNSNPNSN